MKRILFVLLLGSPALAHEVASHGNVSAEFHTDANEQLRVGDDTLVSFRLLVRGEEIDAARCQCQLLLYPGQPSARVMPQILELESGFDEPQAAEGWVRVDEPGPYTLVLAGKPVQAGDFDTFRIEYSLNAYADFLAAPASKETR
ncbi:hypothetical protein [Deinococcus radiophilus]|uniref:Uncharacterized protein n=1 Tax=Deinococcus radiophilus TaxID=32062 RepID=A0A3S0JTM0_9DEIO|nr:hypothetical protein [Deinococcus radiophilus]RTR28701.1 hypothetical protein EJ104_04935 [Deinococcus radiophilus]UFA51124.1 hypothetical protein LMT64_04295 [Deinococcus radiophilus]